MNRRDFLKGMASGAGAVAAGGATSAEARPNREPAPEAVAMLFDSTLCVGCKACVTKCKTVNGMPPETRADETLPLWDSAPGLSAKTLNVIQAYTDGTAEVKDRETDGFAFVKRNCMHCVDPGCVSVCPVSAMTKDANNGIVFYDADACIGCRYCVYACPYDVPQFDYDSAYGAISKCQFCNQRGVERLDHGLLPGCVEACPTGATLFGTREEMLAEARRRLALTPGSEYQYPRETLDAGLEVPSTVPAYYPKIYGEEEGGGTQVLHLSGVAFDKLGLPILPERSFASRSEGLLHTIYQGMFAPVALFAGVAWFARRNLQRQAQDHAGEPTAADRPRDDAHDDRG